MFSVRFRHHRRGLNELGRGAGTSVAADGVPHRIGRVIGAFARFFVAIFIVTELLAGSCRAGTEPVPPPEEVGARTQGGFGGRVIAVRNLGDSGPGSLRAALQSVGPRTVIFLVGGRIDLFRPIVISNPYLTIAGEAAPSPGITITGKPIVIRTHDVIVRHLRIRIGDEPGRDAGYRDGVTILGREDNKPYEAARDVIVDHCSISWAVDENLSLWYPGIEQISITNSIIAEGLNRSIHPKGEHSKGLLVGPGSRGILIRGNLFAHNARRNPAIHPGSSVAVLDNVIYNSRQAIHFLQTTGPLEPEAQSGPLAVISNNVVIAGPDSGRRFAMFNRGGVAPGARIFLDRLTVLGDTASTALLIPDRQVDEAAFTKIMPFALPLGYQPMSDTAEGLVSAVIASAGARPWDRDQTDARIVSEALSRRGTLKDSPPTGELPMRAGAIRLGGERANSAGAGTD